MCDCMCYWTISNISNTSLTHEAYLLARESLKTLQATRPLGLCKHVSLHLSAWQECLRAQMCVCFIISSWSVPVCGLWPSCHPLFLPCIMHCFTLYIYLLLCLSRSKWMAARLAPARASEKYRVEVEVRASWGYEMGRMCLNGRDRSEQSAFCSYLQRLRRSSSEWALRADRWAG